MGDHRLVYLLLGGKKDIFVKDDDISYDGIYYMSNSNMEESF